MGYPKIKVARWLVLVAGLAVVAWMVAQHAALGAWARSCVEFFRAAGPLAFFAAMAVLPMLGFPLSLFNVAAGTVFGAVLGVGNVIACGVLAVAVNVAASYWLAALGLRPVVQRVAGWLGYAVPALPDGGSWEVILLVRLIPGPPFFLQSYVLGLARVPFGRYMLISTLVPGVYLAAVVLAGDAAMRGDWRMVALAAGICFAAGLAIHRVRNRLAAGRTKH